ILKGAGITPKFLGRETNDENQETEYWIHARSRNALGMTPRHRHAFLRAMVQLSHWYKEEGIEPTNPGHSFISEMVVGCPFREVLEGVPVCAVASSLAGAICRVESSQCIQCRTHSKGFPANPPVLKLAYTGVVSTLQKISRDGVSYTQRRELQARLAEAILDLRLEAMANIPLEEIQNFISGELELRAQLGGRGTPIQS